MTAEHRCTVILEPQEEGESEVYVPTLPEVVTYGKTKGGLAWPRTPSASQFPTGSTAESRALA